MGILDKIFGGNNDLKEKDDPFKNGLKEEVELKGKSRENGEIDPATKSMKDSKYARDQERIKNEINKRKDELGRIGSFGKK